MLQFGDKSRMLEKKQSACGYADIERETVVTYECLTPKEQEKLKRRIEPTLDRYINSLFRDKLYVFNPYQQQRSILEERLESALNGFKISGYDDYAKDTLHNLRNELDVLFAENQEIELQDIHRFLNEFIVKRKRLFIKELGKEEFVAFFEEKGRNDLADFVKIFAEAVQQYKWEMRASSNCRWNIEWQELSISTTEEQFEKIFKEIERDDSLESEEKKQLLRNRYLIKFFFAEQKAVEEDNSDWDDDEWFEEVFSPKVEASNIINTYLINRMEDILSFYNNHNNKELVDLYDALLHIALSYCANIEQTKHIPVNYFKEWLFKNASELYVHRIDYKEGGESEYFVYTNANPFYEHI